MNFKIFFLIHLFCTIQIVVGQEIFYRWFDEESLYATILIEKKIEETYIPHGTGFLIYPYNIDKTIIITCEHILRNPEIYITLPISDTLRKITTTLEVEEKIKIKEILRSLDVIWEPDELFFRKKINLVENENFFKHPNGLDIAGIKVSFPSHLLIDGHWIKVYNKKLIPRSIISSKFDVSLGDDCYYVGFPFGIGTPISLFNDPIFTSKPPNPVLRRSSIAWISDKDNFFLLDSFSFPGNSGSPVFRVQYEPGKPPFNLIGIIFGHLESDKNNIGLATCYFTDEILKVIQLIDK